MVMVLLVLVMVKMTVVKDGGSGRLSPRPQNEFVELKLGSVFCVEWRQLPVKRKKARRDK